VYLAEDAEQTGYTEQTGHAGHAEHADSAILQRAEQTGPVARLDTPLNELELQTAIDFALYTRRAENVLKEGDKWIPSILRSLNEAVIVTDAKACITMMNACAEALTGQRQAEAQGKNLPTLFPLMMGDARTL
jgi:PAS domain-containing protein